MENNTLKSPNLRRENLYFLYLIGFFLILALPLLIVSTWFAPLGWGKTIVFRIILSILIFIFLSQAIFKKIAVRDTENKIRSVLLPFWILVILFLIYLLATIFSLDPNFSLWGSPLRSGGFVNLASYMIFAILIFLILKKEDWQKIWDFSIIIGILVSIVAIFQQFGIYSKFFIPFSFRPSGTTGNPILLALYLLLLTFLSLSFFIKSKSSVKKIFYLSSFLLFLFVSLVLTQTRAAFAGLIVGFIWFLFAYPGKQKNFKFFTAIILILIVLGMYFLDAHFYLLEKQPYIIKSAIGRMLSLVEGIKKIDQSRLSTWKVSWQALKAKPILGYGPENFMIGFDKYYDPSLPGIGLRQSVGKWESEVEWWDRAHNFIFDTSLSAGVPALIAYLSLFTVITWQLQKAKRKKPENNLMAHAVQATLIGYLVTNLFSFDNFDTYIIVFLLIGYSFYLISEANLEQDKKEGKLEPFVSRIYPYRKIVMSLLFLLLVGFIFFFNIKPLQATRKSSMAYLYMQSNKCDKALALVDEISSFHNIIDNYLSISSIEVIQNCTNEKIKPTEQFAEQAIQILEKNAKNHPNYTTNWFLLAEYVNILIEEKTKLTDYTFVQNEEMEGLKNKANNYFEMALKLSPNRQGIYKEWVKTGLITRDYEKAKENAQKCIDLDTDYGGCYWLMALTQGYLEDTEKFNYFATLAKEKDYDTESAESLQQLINMYIRTGNYSPLTEVYPKLIAITEDNQQKAQLYSSLAAVYKELGQTENAKKEALKILELIPFLPIDIQTQAKSDVEAFLKSLE